VPQQQAINANEKTYVLKHKDDIDDDRTNILKKHTRAMQRE
jgi:hypothetical protein